MGKCKNLNLASPAGANAVSQVGEFRALQLAAATGNGRVPSLVNIITAKKTKGTVGAGLLSNMLIKTKQFNDTFFTNSFLKIENAEKGRFKVTVEDNFSYIANDTLDEIASSGLSTQKVAEQMNQFRSTQEISKFDPKAEIFDQMATASVDEITRLAKTAQSPATQNANNEIREAMGLQPMVDLSAPLNANLTVSDLQNRIAVAEGVLGHKITLSQNSAYKGRVIYTDSGQPIVDINAQLAERDTVFHEVIGHVFINAIGGLTNKRVANLARELEAQNTSTWQQVVSDNPGMEGDALKLEAVAQSVGSAANYIFENQVYDSMFDRFMDYLFDQIKRLLNLEPKLAYRLAKQGFEADLTEARGTGVFYQTAKRSKAEFVVDMKESNIPGTPGYINFNPTKHEYSKGTRVASRSVTQSSSSGTFIKHVKDVTLAEYNDPNNQTVSIAFREALKIFVAQGTPAHVALEDADKLKSINILAEDIQEGYDRTAEWGTEVHDVFEKIIDGGPTDGYRDEYAAVVAEAKKFRDINKKPGFHVIAEARLFDDGSGLAGSVDVIVVNSNVGSFEIYDFKTKKSYEGHIADIQPGTLDSYTAQLSTYAAMIESKYDIKASKLAIVPIGMEYSPFNEELEGPSTIHPYIQLMERAGYSKIKAKSKSKVEVTHIESETAATISNELKNRITENIKAAIRDKSKSASRSHKDKAKRALEFINKNYVDNEVDSIVEYVSYLVEIVDEITDTLTSNNAENLGVDELHAIRTRLKALNVLDYVTAYIEANETELKDAGAYEWLSTTVDDIKMIKGKHMATTLEGSTKVVANTMVGLSNLHRVESKDKLILKFQADNPKTLGIRPKYEFKGKEVTRAEWNKQLEIYIYDSIKNTLNETDNESLQYWHKYLSEGYVDISALEAYVGDAINNKSLLIQTVNKLFSATELTTREMTMAKRATFDAELERIMAETGKSINEIHDVLVEEDADGVPTGFMNAMYKSEVFIVLNELEQKMGALRKEGREESDEYKELTKERSDTRAKYLNDKGGVRTEYHNSNYKKNKDIIDLYTGLIDSADLHLGFNANLGRSVYGSKAKFYKLPSIRHSTLEAAVNNGLMAAGKEWVGSTFQHRSDDESQEGIEAAEQSVQDELDANMEGVNVSVDGTELREVPIYYRGLVPGNEQSRDVSTMLMNNFNMSVNFGNKSEIQSTVELLVDIMSDNRPLESNGIVSKIKVAIQSDDKRAVRKSKESHEYNALLSVVEQRLYGIGVEKGFMTKTIQAATRYTANTMLIANYMSGMNNWNVGHTANFLESLGNPHMTPVTLLKAKKAYYSDMANILSDIGQPTPKSQTNQLVQYFNIQGEFETLGTEYYKDNAAMKVLSGSNLHFMSKMGEHAIQGQLVYSIMEGVKIMNAMGDYLDKDGMAVSKDKAASLIDVMSIQEGIPTYSVDFYSTSINPTQPHDNNEVSILMQATARSLHGQYDDVQKSKAQRSALGAAAFSMRRWVVALAENRFQGIGSVLTDWNELELGDKSYSEAKQQFDEGRYISAARFMKGIAMDAWKLKKIMASSQWNKLNLTQQDNVIKTLGDIAIMMGSSMAAMLLLGLRGDDKDERVILFAAYMMRRLHSEFAFFHDPREFSRIARTPAVGLSMVENLFDLAARASTVFLGEDSAALERYKRGPRKGELKIKRNFQKVVPLYKQADAWTSLPDKYKFLDTGASSTN